jgi:non-heme chloroperoxidase
MPSFKTRDQTEIYYKDWGSGQPIVFSHGWPLSADAWEDQMFFLCSNGYRCIAHDRRGHGRSSQPWNGNDMDTYVDDLAQLVEKLDIKGAIHIGHSTGVARPLAMSLVTERAEARSDLSSSTASRR